MKYKLLKDLYDCFYIPPELQAQKQEIEECHQALSEVLGKPERRLVLQIIDAKDRIAEDTSIDSFKAASLRSGQCADCAAACRHDRVGKPHPEQRNSDGSTPAPSEN